MKALDAAFKAAAAAQGEGNSGAGAALANAVSGGDAGGSSANSGGSAGTPLASAQGDGGSNPANDNPGGTPMSHSAGDGQQPSGAADHAIAQQGQPSASGAEGGTAAPASSETTGNGSGGNGRFASAAAVAGGAAKHLAAGIARSAGNKASEIADAARERIDNTAGGRLAAEIANPGAAKAERQDRKDADAGRAMAERQQLAAEASQARAMTSSSGADELAPATGTGASKLAFDGNQISAGETEEPEASSKAATGGHGHGN
jgi:type IV secretion system protein VirB6/type IV secretion system protein TrbL